jgi:internalin A
MNLTTVILDSTKVRDFSPLVGLEKLNYLSIDGEQLGGIGVLKNLPNLGLLVSNVRDCSPISALVNLKRLTLWNGGKLSDLSPLSSLIHLESLVIRGENSVSDLSPLKDLPKLEKVRVYGSKVTDFSPVAHIQNFRSEQFWIPFPNIKNKEKYHAASQEIREELPGVPVFKDKSFEQVIRGTLNKQTGEITSGDMAGIENLTVDYRVSDLSDVEYCVNLRNLRLQGTQSALKDLSPLSSLTKLRVLVVWDTGVSDIGPLSGLKNLTNLVLDTSMHMNDISPLSGLTELTQLVLIQSGIDDLSALSGLPNLEELWLATTRVKDFSPVAHVKKVQNIESDPFGLQAVVI